jgi:hypothetical protein
LARRTSKRAKNEVFGEVFEGVLDRKGSEVEISRKYRIWLIPSEPVSEDKV